MHTRVKEVSFGRSQASFSAKFTLQWHSKTPVRAAKALCGTIWQLLYIRAS